MCSLDYIKTGQQNGHQECTIVAALTARVYRVISPVFTGTHPLFMLLHELLTQFIHSEYFTGSHFVEFAYR